MGVTSTQIQPSSDELRDFRRRSIAGLNLALFEGDVGDAGGDGLLYDNGLLLSEPELEVGDPGEVRSPPKVRRFWRRRRGVDGEDGGEHTARSGDCGGVLGTNLGVLWRPLATSM